MTPAFENNLKEVSHDGDNSAVGGQVAPRLNGAGILRPSGVPGAPPFALISPDGRFLAFVEPTQGVSIEGWIGKPAGLIGQRIFAPALGSDLIRVQRIVPVSLRQ
jgi:hypothetical protein